ncbi:efflux RND transporter permease subunit [Hymenobacter psychrotolerans]|uniref:Multidrug efflux pump subunit AcrB n=1 Tax=Hymenobacter psychrotolerans DSM 18569 TaxID=1121959 RepID=A0A1M7GZP3_9BACT|nr:efflux RND transporter permease subunit [Hymenobacter psychrotolerans]SHM21884.1 Multidrug efflux pump subunit AcrB [Hymenobacter psychrotolerans DSM 18569]
MNMIRSALRKPVSVLVMVVGLLFFGVQATREVKIDLLPEMKLPVIYVAHSFYGYTPKQMESYFTKMYVNMLLFTNGIKNIESKNSQGLTLMKVTFHENTNMASAIAEINALSNRSQVFLPPGAPPPFIIRFDASSQPVGQLVFTSPTKNNNQLQDVANFVARPFLISIPGIQTAPPFGGSPRTIEVNIDPELIRAHNLTPDQIVEAISNNNITTPAGNASIGDINYLTPTNTVLKTLDEFGDIPLFKGGVDNVYLRDVATVKDGADITTGYALINGKRSVYINIAKAGDASTWDVVKTLKEKLPTIQQNLPDDVKISYEFDQSVYVINAVKSLVTEGALGALLTGLMVLLFLGDRRAALIVVLTIPISIISGVLLLKLFGQTINLMTLSGLALAIGVLVDESTVTIENIHRHLAMGKPKALAIWDACQEIAFPKLLILLVVLAVFAPAFMMSGIPGALFKPLALAIGFSMIVSFVLSQTFVPVMANWLLKAEHQAAPGKRFERFRASFSRLIHRLMPQRRLVVSAYLVAALGVAGLLFVNIGRDVLPTVNSSQFQVRLRAPDGTRIDRTEDKVKTLLAQIESLVGKEHVAISSVFIGQHPSTFAVSPIYLYNAGPHEALLQVALKNYDGDVAALKDQLRQRVRQVMPGVKLSFEPIELIDKVLSQGSPTPIEVRLSGMNKMQNVQYAKQLLGKLKKIAYLRDQQIAQSQKYPTLNIEIDRQRAAQLGVDVRDISRSLIASTASSRYTSKNLWIDNGMMGIAYDVQVQTPLNKMKSQADLANIPVLKNATRPVLSDVATITPDTTYGESANLGTMGFVTVTANLHRQDLGTATKDVQAAIHSLGELPKGLTVSLIGTATVLTETADSLQNGLLVAVVVVFLLLAANFQSVKVPLVILTTVPTVIVGALGLLLATGSTLNLQSYMGLIMSIGVSLANALLLVSHAESVRKANGGDALAAAQEAAALRLRPIIMTSLAMLAGMLPMAIGHGEGGDLVAPLGRAVIGGLLASTFAVLLLLPLAFAWVQGKSSIDSVSLDPQDADSKHFIPAHA